MTLGIATKLSLELRASSFGLIVLAVPGSAAAKRDDLIATSDLCVDEYTAVQHTQTDFVKLQSAPPAV